MKNFVEKGEVIADMKNGWIHKYDGSRRLPPTLKLRGTGQPAFECTALTASTFPVTFSPSIVHSTRSAVMDKTTVWFTVVIFTFFAGTMLWMWFSNPEKPIPNRITTITKYFVEHLMILALFFGTLVGCWWLEFSKDWSTTVSFVTYIVAMRIWAQKIRTNHDWISGGLSVFCVAIAGVYLIWSNTNSFTALIAFFALVNAGLILSDTFFPLIKNVFLACTIISLAMLPLIVGWPQVALFLFPLPH